MAAALPVIASAVASAAGAAFMGGSIVTAIVSSAIIGFGKMALGQVMSGLMGGKKSSASSGLKGRTFQVRQPTPPRQIVYGELKKSGSLMLAENTDNDKYIHYVVAIASHEVEGMPTVYLNDTPVYEDQIDPVTGAVTSGKFEGTLWIKKHLGSDDQEADPDLIANIPDLDENFRLRGVAYVYVKHKTNPKLYPNGAPVAVRVIGKKLYDTRSGTTRFSYNPTLLWRDYKTSTRYGLGEAESRIPDSYVTAAANICDEFVQTKPVVHTVTAVDTATDALKVSGDILQFQTGDRVQVTTDGVLPTGISAATNYYVIVHKEMKVEDDEISCEIKLASSYLNAVARTPINITAAGSGTHTVTKNAEPRYTASGVIECTEQVTHKDTIEDILISMAGFSYKSGAQWLVFAGAYQAASVAYGVDDVEGNIKYQPRQPRNERYNAVRGVFISPNNYDQPDNYPAVTSTTFQAEDGGERRYMQLDLPFTTRAQTAQRLAKIALLRHRRQGSIILPLNITGLLCQPGDTITFTYDRFGFDEKTFEVIDHEFVTTGDDENPTLGVVITARETDSGVYDFDYASDEVNVPAPPSSNLPNPFRSPLPPSSITLASGTNQLFVASEGTVVTRIKVTLGESPDGYAMYYNIGFKPSASSVWQKQIVRADVTEHYINGVQDGVAYDVSASTINHLGIEGDPIYSYNHVVAGKTELPPDPSTFNISVLADGTRRFTFTLANPPADVRVGGGFKIRYYIGTTSDWSAMTALHNGVLINSPFETNELAAGTYTLACKTVDSTGNESDDALFINTTIGNPRLKNALYQQIENPTWAGTKTNCYVEADGTLHATSSTNWTNLPSTWAGMASSWDIIGTNNTTITYESPVIDLGLDTTFMPLVTVDGVGSPTINIKTGTSSDGNVTGAYGAISGQVTGKRYIQIRVQMFHATAPVITSMSTILDGDVAYEDFTDVDTAAETADWFESVATGHFKIGSKNGDISAITIARITALQNVGAGYTWELISKSETVNGYAAAEFKIYNASNTLADAVVDVELSGTA